MVAEFTPTRAFANLALADSNQILPTVRLSSIPRSWQQVKKCSTLSKASEGIKTRRFGNVLGELETSFRILKECGAHLGGIHIKLTGENVTECVGGASGVSEADLARDYRRQLDPRLNYEQAMELSLQLAHLIAHERG